MQQKSKMKRIDTYLAIATVLALQTLVCSFATIMDLEYEAHVLMKELSVYFLLAILVLALIVAIDLTFFSNGDEK